MSTIRIPPQLVDAVDEDDYPARREWLAALPALVGEIASVWKLELELRVSSAEPQQSGDPFRGPGV